MYVDVALDTCRDRSALYSTIYSFVTTKRECWSDLNPGIILYIRLANERRRYSVMSSLIGWAHSQMIPAHVHLLTEFRVQHFYFFGVL